jgi:flavin reductase (DIM6/NTAB) family NADH-FMN oxidoreductase RutF
MTVTPSRIREVLGRYPTGVSVITGLDTKDRPVGLTVGTFTSVSLDPPLVAFLPDRASQSWPKIELTGRFCVNVLSESQQHVCRAFAATGRHKFRGVEWRPAGSGAPIIEGAVAWVDCDLDSVHDAGDHILVIGAVRAIDIESGAPPLVFFMGGYRVLAPQPAAHRNNLERVEETGCTQRPAASL